MRLVFVCSVVRCGLQRRTSGLRPVQRPEGASSAEPFSNASSVAAAAAEWTCPIANWRRSHPAAAAAAAAAAE